MMDDRVDLQDLAEEVLQLMRGRSQSVVEHFTQLLRQHCFYPQINAPIGNEVWHYSHTPRMSIYFPHCVVVWNLSDIEKASEKEIKEWLLFLEEKRLEGTICKPSS